MILSNGNAATTVVFETKNTAFSSTENLSARTVVLPTDVTTMNSYDCSLIYPESLIKRRKERKNIEDQGQATMDIEEDSRKGELPSQCPPHSPPCVLIRPTSHTAAMKVMTTWMASTTMLIP